MTFEQKHKDVCEVLPTVKTYKQLTQSGRIVEAWEQDEQGVMRDVTLREQERQRAEYELAQAKRTLAKLEEEDGLQDTADTTC